MFAGRNFCDVTEAIGRRNSSVVFADSAVKEDFERQMLVPVAFRVAASIARQPGMFMNLLIVEDNLKMRRMIKSIVAGIADRIDECDDGGEALALYSKNRPDWVLMDIHLKKTNGIEATRNIISIFADARIIIVTNYNDAAFRESAREAGAIEYILKENLFDILPIIERGKD